MAVTRAGYQRQGFDSIRESVAEGLRAGFGQDFLTAPSTDGGDLCDILSGAVDDTEEALEGLVQGMDPREAEGSILEALCAVLGVYRAGATYGTVTLAVEGDEGTAIPAGVMVAGADGTDWETLSEATIGSAGRVTIPAQCTVAGVVEAAAETLEDASGMPAGVDSVTNPDAAVPGAAVESDAALRLSRLARLGASATSGYDALYAALVAVSGAGQVKLYQNITDETDAAGRPPGALEVVTLGGAAAELAAAVWAHIPMGLRLVATGAIWTYDITDAAGGTQTMRGSYAVDVPIYATIQLETESGWNSTSSPAAVKAAVETWANAQIWIGDDVQLLGGPGGGLKAIVAAVKGVKRVGVVTLRRSGESGTADADYQVTPVERARLAAGRITINVS
jgi:uncharacterized phage protein gp47/JayE